MAGRGRGFSPHGGALALPARALLAPRMSAATPEPAKSSALPLAALFPPAPRDGRRHGNRPMGQRASDERGGRGLGGGGGGARAFSAAASALAGAGAAAMSGAGAGTERPSPAKLRRLDEPTGTGPTATVNRGETASSPTPAGGRGEGRSARARGDGSGHARGGGGGDARAPPGGFPEMADLAGEGLETPGKGTGEVTASSETTEEAKEDLENINGCKGSLENTSRDCSEEEKGGSETTREVTGGMETTSEAVGDLEIAVTPSLEKNKGVLETPKESKGSLETASQATGGLESSREVTGSLGSTNGRKGSLETAVTRCLEQGRRSKGGLETTTTKVLGSVESDASAGGELKSTSRRKAKTPARPRASVETASTQSSEWERGREGLEATREDTGSSETTMTGHREQKGVVEFTEEGLEPTACVGQSRGGPGLPDLTGVPAAEESAVISLDEDEEEEEERDEGPARYLAALEAVQLELEAVEEEAARAFRRLRARFCLRRRPHLQRRNRLIQHIPGFWVTAFLNHPQLSAMISDRDEDALSYMTSLQVEEFGQSRPGCRIRFFFSVNPYFQNDVVAKEFVRGPSGHLVSHSTPIRWWQGQDPRSRPHKGPPAPRSFFAWFGDHSFPAGDRVAEIIKEELWPNPLQFYLLGEGAEGPPDSESGEDCVVILDDDEDVQEIPDDGDGSGVEEILTEEPPNPPVGQKDPNRGRI
ncbi:testis-specific Y-encoded-like protein 4 [Haemorhous mexicanus]|uniref:testis-specific Y-encoded-like protein 4 n=1 Tax=Haemorhous mexicanus TaxID=30427 RepID=UPI0028BF2B8D|nr:testis-specific Y-encoded-like protein 4 [Haemorhous mexicanus]